MGWTKTRHETGSEGKGKKADDNNIKARGKKKGELSKMKAKLYCRQKGIKKRGVGGGEVK